VASGQFRADLYYRLHGLALALPALREREDRAALLDSLLAEEAQGSPPPLSEACRRTLLDYSWPGNVRQLRHVLRGLLALHEGGTLHWQALPAELRQASPPPEQASAGALQQAERQALLDSLQAHAWNVSDCARQLGLSRNTLYRKLQRHGIRRH
jgi:transcriptional regulator of acetoin/glycerol metabolism